MNRLPRWLVATLAIVPVVALGVFYVWPFTTLVVEALGATAITDTLGRSQTWEVVWFTLWQALVSTAVTIVVGLVPAYVVARFAFHGRSVLVGLLTATFVLPTVVMGAAFLALLPDSLDRTVCAVIAAHVAFNVAVVVRVVGSLWEHLPTDMEYAAATLGASRWHVVTRISLPLVRPAITAAATIVFLFSFTSFGVIRILGAPGTRTIEVEVWRRATQLGDVGGATVLALLQLTLLAVVLTWSTIVQRTPQPRVGTAAGGAPSPCSDTRRAIVRRRRRRSNVARCAGATHRPRGALVLHARRLVDERLDQPRPNRGPARSPRRHRPGRRDRELARQRDVGNAVRRRHRRRSPAWRSRRHDATGD